MNPSLPKLSLSSGPPPKEDASQKAKTPSQWKAEAEAKAKRKVEEDKRKFELPGHSASGKKTANQEKEQKIWQSWLYPAPQPPCSSPYTFATPAPDDPKKRPPPKRQLAMDIDGLHEMRKKWRPGMPSISEWPVEAHASFSGDSKRLVDACAKELKDVAPLCTYTIRLPVALMHKPPVAPELYMWWFTANEPTPCDMRRMTMQTATAFLASAELKIQNQFDKHIELMRWSTGEFRPQVSVLQEKLQKAVESMAVTILLCLEHLSSRPDLKMFELCKVIPTMSDVRQIVTPSSSASSSKSTEDDENFLSVKLDHPRWVLPRSANPKRFSVLSIPRRRGIPLDKKDETKGLKYGGLDALNCAELPQHMTSDDPAVQLAGFLWNCGICFQREWRFPAKYSFLNSITSPVSDVCGYFFKNQKKELEVLVVHHYNFLQSVLVPFAIDCYFSDMLGQARPTQPSLNAKPRTDQVFHLIDRKSGEIDALGLRILAQNIRKDLMFQDYVLDQVKKRSSEKSFSPEKAFDPLNFRWWSGSYPTILLCYYAMLKG